MVWHGSSEREGAALPQADESGTGGEAHPAPSNGRSPRLPPLGLEVWNLVEVGRRVFGFGMTCNLFFWSAPIHFLGWVEPICLVDGV